LNQSKRKTAIKFKKLSMLFGIMRWPRFRVIAFVGASQHGSLDMLARPVRCTSCGAVLPSP
jgi:hypothetical protein